MSLTDCNLITGEQIDCRNSVGGIKAIYITEFQNKASITDSSGTITAFTLNSGKKFWTYEMEKGNAEATEAITPSLDNGTLFFLQTIGFNLKKLSAQKRNNVYKLAQNRVMIIFLDKNGVCWLMGQNNGMDLIGTNEAKSGKLEGDLNGYNLAFEGREESPMNVVTPSLIASLTVQA